ncbi:aromatic acid exporter family protein [Metabacillus sp. GX 13764]|uniref:FUSC family protein n=1 Tax=Metabacillus kandeliae TaxID=2900151 RepID=UPI001E4D1CB3|nr:aromatic acid exporter family protein [Metabacillus kandeliae]MCD7036397.1 aromatic acid exporter family protein [Metabacillus kandeliae]
MKLGARIIKTGIAMTLALWIAGILNLPSPAFAGISAIFAIQPTIYRSYLSMIEQIQANIIGAAFAIAFGLVFGPHPFIIGLTVVIVIMINLRLKIENTIAVSLVTVVAIMESQGDHFLQFALMRFGTVMLGVAAAFLVNLIFLPPKYEKKVYSRIVANSEEILKWIRLSLRQASEHTALKEDIDKLKDKMIKLDQLYLLYKEERTYFRQNVVAKSRKLVLFRQMLLVTNKALSILRNLHRVENELPHTTEKFREQLEIELDYLLNFHERIHLKLTGKIKAQSSDLLYEELSRNKKNLMTSLTEYQNTCKDHNCFYHIIPLVGSILDYSEQLEHLDTLITSYQSHHKEDSEIELSSDPE